MPPEEFDYEDAPSDEDDVTLDEIELYGIPIYDLPEWFEPTAVVVMVKGYIGDNEAPALLFRASGNLALYEIQAILGEGIKQAMDLE